MKHPSVIFRSADLEAFIGLSINSILLIEIAVMETE